ncbi:XdhC family protein [Stenotrophomonas sp. HITSZ_GD]|uniref:XdhC family protein n=1 Tax=Stenotrophomonas sp. HITSZ_GD TaxID=3037248 RepID=UPI00240E7D25|nr:XdhC/CoxI family protein [Stenotrophomonas sp. HITSZ_GD]MDG2523783.1 XdhC family protein [Stenotrophomonas sp. HITSZ_GD]
MTAARHGIEASLAAARHGRPATLAVVFATEGSTYVKPGALAVFGEDDVRQGWLSGGCLEADIARAAEAALHAGEAAWMEIDTRGDEDLLSGAAVGCRGRLHLALLPLPQLPGWDVLARAWLARQGALQLRLGHDGACHAEVGTQSRQWSLTLAGTRAASLQVRIAPPPAVVLFGAGPESATLLPWLRELGWMTTLVEKRPRWRDLGALADRHIEATPTQALADGLEADAVLAMHHHFELDRETLDGLATHPVPFIGLLGPRRRQQDLFQLLTPAQREALLPRLRSPVGLHLGGEGPQAIALSIAAQLQRWYQDEDAMA